MNNAFSDKQHLSKARLLELATERNATVLPYEQAHLDLCKECKHAYLEDQALNQHLQSLPKIEVPDDFVRKATVRFTRAIRQKRLRVVGYCLAALAFSQTLLLLLAVMIATNLNKVVHDVGIAIQVGVRLLVAIFAVLMQVPPAALFGLVAASAIALMMSGFLHRVGFFHAAVK